LTWSVWEGALLRMKVEGSAQPVREGIALMLDHMYLPTAKNETETLKIARRSSR
jgi:TetR/AcrR family transcriptional regulator, transcriptional repressor for nem operon